MGEQLGFSDLFRLAAFLLLLFCLLERNVGALSSDIGVMFLVYSSKNEQPRSTSQDRNYHQEVLNEVRFHSREELKQRRELENRACQSSCNDFLEYIAGKAEQHISFS